LKFNVRCTPFSSTFLKFGESNIFSILEDRVKNEPKTTLKPLLLYFLIFIFSFYLSDLIFCHFSENHFPLEIHPLYHTISTGEIQCFNVCSNKGGEIMFYFLFFSTYFFNLNSDMEGSN